jgi:hypothetical protein
MWSFVGKKQKRVQRNEIVPARRGEIRAWT